VVKIPLKCNYVNVKTVYIIFLTVRKQKGGKKIKEIEGNCMQQGFTVTQNLYLILQ